jgi:hypothetical protein
MIFKVPARAKALGLLVLASSASCSSHVDVGFTSEGASQTMSDAGDASRPSSNTSNSADVMTAACTFARVCDAGTCRLKQIFADWCTEVCQNSIDICDNGECVDLSSDPKNCGRCGRECSAAEKCVMSDCRR